MKNNYDDLDKALNVESSIVGVEKTPKSLDVVTPKTSSKPDDVKKDYDYTRANLYSLIEKGQETLNGIMELASEGGSPRAYEVAGQIIKSVADTTDKLMELQKKVKEVDEESPSKTNNVTNNAVFIGSTSDLSKMLKKGFLDSNSEK